MLAENNPLFSLSYLDIWRDPTIPEASVFSIQMLDKYLGTWGKISDDKITNEVIVKSTMMKWTTLSTSELTEITIHIRATAWELKNTATFTSQTALDTPEQSTSDPIFDSLNIFRSKVKPILL